MSPKPSATRKHPTERQLADFLNGNLSPKSQLAVENHIESCGQCVNVLEGVKGDTLGDRLRNVGTRFDEIDGVEEEDSIPPALANHARYEIVKKIGTGGMGEVYQGVQRSMDRPVAIKVLRRHLFENDRAVARFQNEIKVAAKLNHSNIVHSYDAEVSNGLNILVMELVEGEKLSDLVADGKPMSARKACHIATQIATGLQYANASQAMIHRDIKPQNVLVTPDESVKILDFGLAKFVRDSVENQERDLTAEGETFGTPDYIAPEQIRDSAAADCRSDIYSLGCTLYFMLTGRPPFTENSVGEKLAGHLTKTPDSVFLLRSDLPPELLNVVERMMHKNPEQRFESHSDVINALKTFTAPVAETALPLATPLPSFDVVPSVGGTAKPVAPASHPLRPLMSRSWARFGVVIGMVAVALGIAMVASSWMGNAKSSPTRKIAVVAPSLNAWHQSVDKLTKNIERVGYEWEVLSNQTGTIQFHPISVKNSNVFEAARTLADAKASEFDAVIFTGAWDQGDISQTVYAFDSKLNSDAKVFLKQMLEQEKPVGGICAGTGVLAKAGVLVGKPAARCSYLKPQTSPEEAEWVDCKDGQHQVIESGLFVTGSNHVNAREMVLKMVDQLGR